MHKILALILKPSRLIRIIVFLALILIAIAALLGYLEPIKKILDSNALTLETGNLKISLYEVLKGLFALTVLFWLASLISSAGEKRLKSLKKIKSSNKALLVKGYQALIYFFVFIIALEVMGIDLTSLAVLGGAIGIGIGFGLQKITSNFISGLILLFEKSVEEGDLIELSDGTYGFIRQTGARYNLLETFDGKEIMIPNEDFITNRVVNWTYSNKRGRIAIPIGVSYESDIEKARSIILEAAINHPRSSKEEPPQCHLREYGESSVNFLLYFWVDDVTTGLYEPQSDVMRSIWKKFKQHNIVIPYPQRDLHIKNIRELKND